MNSVWLLSIHPVLLYNISSPSNCSLSFRNVTSQSREIRHDEPIWSALFYSLFLNTWVCLTVYSFWLWLKYKYCYLSIVSLHSIILWVMLRLIMLDAWQRMCFIKKLLIQDTGDERSTFLIKRGWGVVKMQTQQSLSAFLWVWDSEMKER